MDFGDIPTTRATERIMAEIAPHLKREPPPKENYHYNRVYEILHRNLLAVSLVARLPASEKAGEP